jgi:hypothetical protein
MPQEQKLTEQETREQWLSGLEELVKLLRDKPELPLPAALYLHSCQHEYNNTDVKAKMATIAKAFAPCEKEYSEDYFLLVRSFGPHTIKYFTSRSAVCTAKVAGKKMVEAKPSSYYPEVPAHEVDVIEWECSPLLETTDEKSTGPSPDFPEDNTCA